MGRFLKLNHDVQQLSFKMLEDSDIRKLIFYNDTEIIDKPDINIDKIFNKRLFLFTSKLPFVAEKGTYVMIRPFKFRPVKGGYFIISLLCFDIYVHQNIRNVVFQNSNNDIISGDRILMIMDKIDKFMSSYQNQICVNQDNLDGSAEISTRNAEFAGFTLAYKDISFR